MRCDICSGACCESLIIPAFVQPDPASPSKVINEINQWLSLHGQIVPDKGIELEAPCSWLKDGGCQNYEDRPLPCVMYISGGEDCLETVRTRRTPEQYQEIRNENDPKTLN